MHARATHGWWLTIVLCLAGGCGTPQAEQSAATSPGGATGATAAADVKLAILDFEEIQRLIADKRGKVVVLDAWSTSCPPCTKDFHNLVELDQAYPDDDLACISLSFDFEGLGKPEDVQEPVLQFLRSQGATFDNVMSNVESDVLYRKFGLNSVPAIFVYDRQGTLHQRFEDEGAYDRVRALVAELVEQPAPADAAGE